MAVEGLVDANIYLGAKNLTGFSNSFDANYGAEMLDDTKMNDTTRTMFPGLKTFDFTVAGIQDWDATTGLGSTMFDRIGAVEEVLTFSPGSSGSEGNLAFFVKGVNGTYAPLSGSVGELIPFELTGGASHALIRGEVAGIGAKIVTFTGAGSQIGALSATQRMYVAVHLTAVSGSSPTIDTTVESDDNGGFTSTVTQITIPQQTGVGAQFSSVAGAISDDWWRVVMTIGGSSPSFTVHVALGIL